MHRSTCAAPLQSLYCPPVGCTHPFLAGCPPAATCSEAVPTSHCLPTDRPACLHLLPAGGKEAKPIAAIDTTWLALGELAGSGPQGDLPPCTGLDDVAKERELAGNVVRGINEARL